MKPSHLMGPLFKNCYFTWEKKYNEHNQYQELAVFEFMSEKIIFWPDLITKVLRKVRTFVK
jgi:hypothetical protein